MKRTWRFSFDALISLFAEVSRAVSGRCRRTRTRPYGSSHVIPPVAHQLTLWVRPCVRRTHSRQLAEFWMIDPEIAFADLSDDAGPETLLRCIFAVLLNERHEDSPSRQRIEKGLVAKTRGNHRLGVRAYGLRPGDRGSARSGGSVRTSSPRNRQSPENRTNRRRPPPRRWRW